MLPVTLFVDSADRARTEPLLATGLFAGVTTNPTILERAGATRDDIAGIAEWAGAEDREVCFQVWGADADAMLDSASWLLSAAPDATIKVPVTREGCAVMAQLGRAGVPVLATAVYSARQALLASALGVRWIAPYFHRMGAAGRDGLDEVAQMVRILPQDGSGPRILAASIKSVDEVMALAGVGVRAFTLSPDVCDALLDDELTTTAAADFEAAMARVLGAP